MVLPFLPVVLRNCELSASQIALTTSLGPLASTILPPFYGALATRYAPGKMVLLACAIAILPVLGFLGNPVWPSALILAFLVLASLSVANPTLEGLGMRLYPDGKDYSNQRLYGSLGFIAGSVLAGAVLEGGSNTRWSLFLAATLLISLPAFWWLPRGDEPNPGEKAELSSEEIPVNWSLVIFLLILTFLMNIAHAPYFTFLNLILGEKLGVPSALHGTFWGLAVIAETFMMFFYARIFRRWHFTSVLALSLLMAAIRWFFMARADSADMVYGLQTLHAFSFASFHLAIMEGLTRSFPPIRRSIGSGLYASIGFGLAMMSGNQLSALFVDQIGMQGLFTWFALAPAAGIPLALMLRFRFRRGKYA